MDRITRIETMEKKLNAALAAVHALDRALEDYAAAQKDIRALEKYLSGRARRTGTLGKGAERCDFCLRKI